MKKAIIYDLDYTLFDPNTLDKSLFHSAFDILKEVEQASDYNFAELQQALFSLSLKTFINQYLNEDEKERFVQSLNNITALPKLEPYGDVFIVPTINTTNYIITSGPTQFQNQKIDALGIRDWFSEIYVDDPIVPIWKDKEEIMRLILKKHHYETSEILVVGDSPNSEIQAGNNIGIDTIQILRSGIIPSKEATYTIKSLNELNNYI